MVVPREEERALERHKHRNVEEFGDPTGNPTDLFSLLKNHARL